MILKTRSKPKSQSQESVTLGITNGKSKEEFFLDGSYHLRTVLEVDLHRFTLATWVQGFMGFRFRGVGVYGLFRNFLG